MRVITNELSERKVSSEERKNDLLTIFSTPFTYRSEQEKRIISVPEAKTLNEYQVIFARAGSDAIKLLVNYQKAQLAKKGIHWNCFVIEYGQKLIDELNRLLNIPLEIGASYRVHLLVQQISHFTNIDIKVTRHPSGNLLSIALFDAANSWQYKLALLPALKSAKDNNSSIQHLYFTEADIQKDELTCPIISYLLAKNIRNIPDFHQLLARVNPNDGLINWQVLPNALLKQVQSFTFVDSLGDKKHLACNKKNEPLLAYLMRHQGFYANLQPDKRRNFAALDSYQKNAERLHQFISAIPADEVAAMIDSGVTLKPAENTAKLNCK